jgi:hypothetical protein
MAVISCSFPFVLPRSAFDVTSLLNDCCFNILRPLHLLYTGVPLNNLTVILLRHTCHQLLIPKI